MINEGAKRLPATPRKGQILTAEQINRIVDGIIRRISGGKGIKIRAMGDQIVIEESDA